MFLLLKILYSDACTCAGSQGLALTNGINCACNGVNCGTSGSGCNGKGYVSCTGEPDIPLSGCWLPGQCSSICSLCTSTCVCDQGWTGPFCETQIQCFGILAINSTVCSSRGACNAQNVCTCSQGWGGATCNLPMCYGRLSNDTANVCSGRGTCIAPDVCSNCTNNYGGANCHLPRCHGRLSNDTNVCSGHGTCVSPDLCSCQAGWTRAQCEMTLCFGTAANATSNVCSGRGTCVAPDVCVNCGSRYGGSNCHLPICYGRLSNHTLVCSGRGTCVSPDVCSSCIVGFGGSACQLPICYGRLSNHTLVCNGRGSCVAPDVCSVCQSGWTGSQCQLPICYGKPSNATGLVCSGRGTCVAPDVCANCGLTHGGSNCELPRCYGLLSNATKAGAQVCNGRGTCVAPDVCSCSSLWSGSNCQHAICFGIVANSTSVCSGRGTCVAPDVCSSCSSGWGGSQCQTPLCYGRLANDTARVCNGRGTCVAPDVCSTCANGWHGSQCQHTICYGIRSNQTSPLPCSGRGTCVAPDVCSGCAFNWGGSQCDLPICYGIIANRTNVCSARGRCVGPNSCVCNTGFFGSKCDSVFVCNGRLATDPIACSGRGACYGPNLCNCTTPGWNGTNCANAICNGTLATSSLVCSGHGSCNLPNNCTCVNGWTGPQCQLQQCFGKLKSDPSVCSSRGNCSGPNQCTCPAGWTGSECQFFSLANIFCYGKSGIDANVCSGRGSCVNTDQCVCNSARYFGSECQFSIYHWKTRVLSGTWSQASNWVIETNYLPIEASRPPGLGDLIYIDSPGVVTLDVPNFRFQHLELGLQDDEDNQYMLILRGNNIFDGNIRIWSNGVLQLASDTTTTISGIFNHLGILDVPVRAELHFGTVNSISDTILAPGPRTSQDLTIKNLNNDGVINFLSTKTTLTSNVVNRANINLYGDLSGELSINNIGTLEVRTSPIKNITIDEKIKIVNTQNFHITGNGTTFMNSFINSQPYSNFTIQETIVVFPKSINITDGFFSATGTIQVPILGVTTSTGVVYIQSSLLNILGSFYVDQNCTVFYKLTEKEKNNVKLKVRDEIIFQGLLFVKISSEMSVGIGDTFSLVSYGSAPQDYNVQVMLAGAAYKKATLKLTATKNINLDVQQSNKPSVAPAETGMKIADLIVDISVGNVGFADQYKCHYLGNRKIIEVVNFPRIKKVAVTLTAPTVSGWSGFAISSTNRLNDSLLIAIANMGETFLLKNHYNVTQDRSVIDLSATTSTSLFSIGKLYQSITAFVETDILTNAKSIFYAENGRTYSEHLTTLEPHGYDPIYEFDLFNGPYVPCTNFLAPSRIEARHPASIAIILGIYVLLFVLCIVFIRVQPLKSRGLAPTFTLLFLTFELGFQTRNFDLIPVEQRSLCLFDAYLLYPLHQVLFWMILLYFIRYYAVISINTLKNTGLGSQDQALMGAFGSKETDESTLNNAIGKWRSFQISILKYMNNTWIMLAFVLIYIIFSAILNTIIIAASKESLGKFLCGFETLSNLRLANSILLLLTLLGVFVLVVSDIIANWRLVIKCHLHTYLLKTDPYYFRLQMVFFLPVTILVVVSELYNFIALRTFLDMIYLHTGIEVVNTIMFALILFVDVILPLSITIIRTISSCFKPKVKKTDKIDEILNDPEAYKLFVEFAKYEFAVENIYAWKDLSDYKRHFKDPEKYLYCFYGYNQKENSDKKPENLDMLREAVGLLIVSKYFNGVKSLYQSNITAGTLKRLQEKVSSHSFDESIFDEAFGDIRANICDSYSRFISYPPWRQYVASMKLKEDLLERGQDPSKILKNVGVSDFKQKVRNSMRFLKGISTQSNKTKSTELKDIVSPLGERNSETISKLVKIKKERTNKETQDVTVQEDTRIEEVHVDQQ